MVGCADKVVQIPRIVELWREAKELEDRRLLCGRDGNANEMAMLAALCPSVTSGSPNGPESVPCVLQVQGCAWAHEACRSHPHHFLASIIEPFRRR